MSDIRRRLRVLPAAASAIVLVTIACGKPPDQGMGPKAKSWRIVVGPGECDLKDEETGGNAPTQVVSKKEGHVVQWRSNAGQSLSLVFHVPASCKTPPFGNMNSLGPDPNGKSMFELAGNPEGKINSGRALNECGEGIKYDQILGGKKCDGIIIIQP